MSQTFRHPMFSDVTKTVETNDEALAHQHAGWQLVDDEQAQPVVEQPQVDAATASQPAPVTTQSSSAPLNSVGTPTNSVGAPNADTAAADAAAAS